MNKKTTDLPEPGDPIPDLFFRLIANFTYDWESWVSSDGRLLWVNDAVTRFTGYTPDECLAMTRYPLPLISREDRRRLLDRMQEAQAGITANNIEFYCQHRNGSKRWAAVSWQPMRSDDGRPLGYRASVRDIEDKRLMREQLRRHNEQLEQLVEERTAEIAKLQEQQLKIEKLAAMGELSAGVAHEINNPLAGIRNAFALLRRNLPENIKHYDKLELIDREIERISGITHQMYQLYRPSGQSATKFSIVKLVSEAISLSMPLARKRKVDIEYQLKAAEATPTLGSEEVCLREPDLKQVLLNLIRNAIQASQAGQQVLISSRLTINALYLTVKDHGHGIHQDHMDKIFRPFFSTKTEVVGQGMGLGLSVSRSIVEAMDGTIEVISEPGIGTEFSIRLPRLR